MARHKNKHIQAAIEYAESLGWTLTMSKGHMFGHLWCSAGCCRVHVYSTPRVPEHHAAWIRREVDKCPGGQAE